MGICKKAFRSKEGKLRKGVIASVVLSIAILTGGIQWFSATASSNTGDFNQKQMQQSDGGQSFNNGNTGNTTNTNQGPPNGDFHGRDGHDGGSSGSPFLVVLNYFAIWAAIIIPTYFLEKRIFMKKRKSREVHPQNS